MVSKLNNSNPPRFNPEKPFGQPNPKPISALFDEIHAPKGEFAASHFGALLAGYFIGRACKRNRDAHLGADRSKMGFLERLGLLPLPKKWEVINGQTVEVTFYPRLRNSKAEITSGPSDLLGLTVENLNCHEADWKDKASSAIKNEADKRIPKDIPYHRSPKAETTLPIGTFEKILGNKTENDQMRKLDNNIEAARKNRNNATPEKKQEAKHNFSKAIEKKLERVGPLVPDDQSVKSIFLEHLHKKQVEGKNDADAGRNQVEKAQKKTGKIEAEKVKAKKLEKKLERKDLGDGTKKEIANKRNKTDQKISILKTEQKQQIKQGTLKASANRATERVASEAIGQVVNMGANLKLGAASNGIDVIADYLLEGKKCDLETAAMTVAVSTLTSSATQMGTSLAYEGIIGAIEGASPELAKNLPGLGELLTGANAINQFRTAPTNEEGLRRVGEVALEFGTKAVVGGILIGTGAATGGLPVIIVGQLSWRVVKHGYNWTFPPATTVME